MALGEAPENGRPEVLARALRRPPSRVPRSESKTAVPVQVADRQRSDLGAAQAGHESMQNSGPASPTLLPTEGHPAQAGLRDLAFLRGQDAASLVGCLPFLPVCAAYPGRGTRRPRPLPTLRTMPRPASPAGARRPLGRLPSGTSLPKAPAPDCASSIG